MNPLRPVLPVDRRWPLHGVASARRLEQAAAASLPVHTLMQRAGLATARLALAVAPHASSVLVLVGPGNNGGDGLEAAMHLARAGRRVDALLAGDAARLPEDAARSLVRAREAGVRLLDGGFADADWQAGLLVDALLGIGVRRAPEGRIADAIARSHAFGGTTLAVDLPSGLAAETGACPGDAVRAQHTLSLLALKPGLFTGEGRERSGRVWHDDLGVDPSAEASLAYLPGADENRAGALRSHAQHKGSFGDVLVIGGAAGMAGAARLAARSALAAGAGRVYLSPLDADAGPDPARPELMHRDAAWRGADGLLARATVVCGCGGGTAVAAVLDGVLRDAGPLVLDADALNAVARGVALQDRLARRARLGRPTVLTPHPLEAARLLGVDTAAVQADRLGAAVRLATRFDCTVLLKGSGSVLAAPGALPRINTSGNARLATAGTGDVLAGWLGGLWAQHAAGSGHESALTAAVAAAWRHGAAADRAAATLPEGPLLAAELIDAMRAAG